VAKAGRNGTLGERVSIGGAPWKIDGCPLKATAIAVAGRTIYAASFNGAEEPAGLYTTVSRDGGGRFPAPQPLHPEAAVSDAPSLALAGGGAVAAWHAKVGDVRRVYLRTLGHDSALGPVFELPAPEGTAQSPTLVTDGTGVRVVWQQGDQIYTAAVAATRRQAKVSR
jgi:hypothetical protein